MSYILVVLMCGVGGKALSFDSFLSCSSEQIVFATEAQCEEGLAKIKTMSNLKVSGVCLVPTK